MANMETSSSLRNKGMVNPDRNVISEWINKFGLSLENAGKVKKTEDLRKSPPNIVVVESLKTFDFHQTNGDAQKLIKKNKYIMSLSMVKSLWVDKQRKIQLLKPSSIKFTKLYKPYTGQDLTDKKILFMRHGGIGDLLFINVILKYLKKLYPTCHIAFSSGPQYQTMLEGWIGEYIDELINLPIPMQKFMKFDYHAVFEGVIERNDEGEQINAYELFSKWLNLDIPKKDLIPSQNPKPQRIIECKTILSEWGLLKDNKKLIVQLTASSPIRNPSTTLWKKILDKFLADNWDIIISDSPHKINMINEFIDKFDDEQKKHLFNFAEKSIKLDFMIAMTSLCDFVLSTDSGILHVAASLDKPMFGLYGPFLGEIRLSTYRNADWINAQCDCAPCFQHGYEPCKNTINWFSKCFENIDPQEVFDRSLRVFQGHAMYIDSRTNKVNYPLQINLSDVIDVETDNNV
jgi:ADP-heptose:LPS heptosyltransferase